MVHNTLYIGHSLRRGRDWDRYVWMGASPPASVMASGTFGGWLHTVAVPCAASSYLAFALLVALAGPVLAWADLPEGAVFHFAGQSSTGKTTTARVAATIDGPPDSHGNWHQSDRRTGENAAIRCDRVYILNAAEKAKREDLRAVLSSITHGLVEGGSKKYAAAVKATLPDLRIRSPILSNGNRSGAEMARMAGLPWDEQEAARFITIPVPPREEGGVIDRPRGTGPGSRPTTSPPSSRTAGRRADHPTTRRRTDSMTDAEITVFYRYSSLTADDREYLSRVVQDHARASPAYGADKNSADRVEALVNKVSPEAEALARVRSTLAPDDVDVAQFYRDFLRAALDLDELHAGDADFERALRPRRPAMRAAYNLTGDIPF